MLYTVRNFDEIANFKEVSPENKINFKIVYDFIGEDFTINTATKYLYDISSKEDFIKKLNNVVTEENIVSAIKAIVIQNNKKTVHVNAKSKNNINKNDTLYTGLAVKKALSTGKKFYVVVKTSNMTTIEFEEITSMEDLLFKWYNHPEVIKNNLSGKVCSFSCLENHKLCEEDGKVTNQNPDSERLHTIEEVRDNINCIDDNISYSVNIRIVSSDRINFYNIVLNNVTNETLVGKFNSAKSNMGFYGSDKCILNFTVTYPAAEKKIEFNPAYIFIKTIVPDFEKHFKSEKERDGFIEYFTRTMEDYIFESMDDDVRIKHPYKISNENKNKLNSYTLGEYITDSNE